MNDTGHFYDKDGNPVWEIDGRKTRVSDARELGLLPSWTTVAKLLDKPFINNWRVDQAYLRAVTSEMLEGEDEEQFVARMKTEDWEDREATMGLGTALHNLNEKYLLEKSLGTHTNEEWRSWEKGPKAWIDENVAQVIAAEDAYANVEVGFGGTIDSIVMLHDGRVALVDFKTQRVKGVYKRQTMLKTGQLRRPGEIKATFYDEFTLQLAAYRELLSYPVDVCISLAMSTNPDFPGALSYEWPESDLARGWEIARRTIEIFYFTHNLPFPEVA